DGEQVRMPLVGARRAGQAEEREQGEGEGRPRHGDVHGRLISWRGGIMGAPARVVKRRGTRSGSGLGSRSRSRWRLRTGSRLRTCGAAHQVRGEVKRKSCFYAAWERTASTVEAMVCSRVTWGSQSKALRKAASVMMQGYLKKLTRYAGRPE